MFSGIHMTQNDEKHMPEAMEGFLGSKSGFKNSCIGGLSIFEIPLRDAIEKLTRRPSIYQSRNIDLKLGEESSFELDDWQKLARRTSS